MRRWIIIVQELAYLNGNTKESATVRKRVAGTKETPLRKTKTGKTIGKKKLMNSLQKRIVCAAMLMKDGSVVAGIRHFSPEMRAIMLRAYGEKYHLQVQEQGFVDQFGAFYSREQAWKLADQNGQIIRPTGWEENPKPRPANVGDEGCLFSENLY